MLELTGSGNPFNLRRTNHVEKHAPAAPLQRFPYAACFTETSSFGSYCYGDDIRLDIVIGIPSPHLNCVLSGFSHVI